MSSRRLFALVWLALAAGMLAAPLLAADGCDEPCDLHCGDCVWCPLNAELLSAVTSVTMIGGDVPPPATRNASLVPARVFDHVPLAI
jgi:hypothetical protein